MKRKKIIIVLAVLVLGFIVATLWVKLPRTSPEKKKAKARMEQNSSAVNSDSGFYLRDGENKADNNEPQDSNAGSSQSEQNNDGTLELKDDSRFNDETFVKGIFTSMAVKEADPDVDDAVDNSVVDLIGNDADLSSWYAGREDTTVIEENTTVDLANHTVTFSNLEGTATKTYSYTVENNKVVSAEVVQ